MGIERKKDHLNHWKKTIRFSAQNRPIAEKDLHIPTCDIQTEISTTQAKATEALIEELYVKPEDYEKLTLNELQDICPKKYRLKDVIQDHKAASFALIRGLWHASAFHLADYRPNIRGGKRVNQEELNKRLKAVNSNDEEVDVEQLQLELKAKDDQLAEKDDQLAEKDEQLAEKDEQLAEKDEQLADKDKLIQVLQAENTRLKNLLAQMKIETQSVTSDQSSSKKRKIG